MASRGIGRSASGAATLEPNSLGISDLQNGWLAGASFNYQIWRNLLLTLDYQYTNVRSNVAFGNFMTNMGTAGVTYKY